MSTTGRTLVSLLALCFATTLAAQTKIGSPLKMTSPNGEITLLLSEAGTATDGSGPSSTDLTYAVEFRGKRMMETARLGLELVGQPALGPGMRLTAAQPESADETYTIPVGKTSSVRDHYNGVRADFEDAAGRKLTVEVRAFDDGVAFRYAVPDQPSLKQVRIAHELTEFTYAKDATTYPLILDGYQSSYEDEYQLRQGERAASGLADRPAVSGRRAGPGLGGDYRGQHRQLRGHVSAQGRAFLRSHLQADLSPHAIAPGSSTRLAVETSTPFTAHGAC